MKYFACHIDFPTPLEPELLEIQHDLLAYHLGEIGFDSFVTTDATLIAYIPQSLYSEETLRQLLLELYEEAEERPAFVTTEMEDRNWNEEWERNYFAPLVIDDEVTIRATFHPASSTTPVEILIDPKMAFGTGNHATTASMLRLIRRVDPRGLSVIDMGCGSGILGIYAMKIGAQSCTAIDYDEWSVRNTIDNAQLNHVSIDTRHGDASALEGCPRVDLFLANINRNIILADLEHYLAHTKDSGRLLLSGFYEEDIPLIAEALHHHGRRIVDHIVDNHWVALLCR